MNAGRVVQTGTPQEMYFRPQSAFAAEFLGVSNQLAGTASADGMSVGAQRMPYAGTLRGPITLIFKATDATLAVGAAPDDAEHVVLRGVLEERLFLGSAYRHYVRIGDDTLMVDAAEPVEPGPLAVRIPAGKLQVYAAPSG
jgi:putative spermidine/putrescine transport system ATP-binding protein